MENKCGGGLLGIEFKFDNLSISSFPIQEGDILSFAVKMKASPDSRTGFFVRFRDSLGNNISQQHATTRGGTDNWETLKLENLTVPPLATNALIYFDAGINSPSYLSALWILKATSSGISPPKVQRTVPLTIQNKKNSSRIDHEAMALAPRLFALEGLESNVYPINLRAGLGQRIFDFFVTDNRGAHQNERWTWTPLASDEGNYDFIVSQLDPDTLEIKGESGATLSVIASGAAQGHSIKYMAIGDSTTASNYRIQRVVELSNLRPADAQITLIGTNGSSPILHEGRPGWTVKKYYQPFGADAIENPFVENEGDKFDAAYYISTSGQPVPEVISWTLGINDVFSATSDIELQQRMDVFLSQLSQMIGIEEAMDVTSWKEVDASIVHLVSLPILPYSQDGFAPLMWPYKQNIPVSASGQSRARYWRNIVGASLRMIEYFKDKESDNIFLMPFNSSIDIINNAPKKIVTPWNRHARGIVRRDSNDVHPLDAGGNNQLGDVEYALLNWLVVTGRITSHE